MKHPRISLPITVSAFLASIVLAQSILFSLPNTAHAQAGGGCAALLVAKATGLAEGAAAGTSASLATLATGIPTHDAAGLAAQVAVSHGQTVEDTTKCILDSLAWTVAKTTVQSITRSTVNWINSGFNGSPAFVSDLNANLSNLSDTVADNFFRQLDQVTIAATGFNLRSPFQDQITQQLRANYYQATGSLLGLNQYNLQNYSSDPQAFLNGGFRQGGINAFFAASQNPANNPFGAYMIASQALTDQISAAAAQRKSELDWGKGFLPWRGGCSSVSKAEGAEAVTLSQSEKCIGNPVRTPGAVIESQLENNLGSGVRQLELADSIDEIVGALMGQLVNQVLGSGGLFGASQPSAGGGSSYVDQLGQTTPTTTTSPQTTQPVSIAQGVQATIASDIATLTTYRDNWQSILDVATIAKNLCGTRDDIASVFAQATLNLGRANTALQQETAIQTSINAAAANTGADSSTQITTALTQYQTFLAAATTPSETDKAYAATQSVATSNETLNGAKAEETLYSKMVAAKNTCTRTGTL